MSAYIKEVFGPQGILARKFEGYNQRKGQVELAVAVDAAIRDGGHLMAEAPTGIGKTVGYGVPAIYHAANEGKRVVIATANIALQEQLVGKDLPLLSEVLPWEFSFALLKGKSNYLCHGRLYQEKADGTLDLLDDPGDGKILDALVAWAGRTSTGDVSELAFQPPHRLWRRFSTTAEDCKGSDCHFRDECFSLKARAAAQEADIVVCNYHLLFAHLQVRESTGQDIILPPFDAAVLDEAHKAADIARDFFGFHIGRGAIKWAGRLLKKIGESPLQEALAKETDKLFERLIEHRRSDAYRVRLKTPNAVPWTDMKLLLEKVAGAYRESDDDACDSNLRADLRRAGARCVVLASQLKTAMTLSDPDSVFFIDEDSKKNAVLCCKPIEVGDRLRKELFEKTRSVVLTSATLTTGGSFKYIRCEMGAPEPSVLAVDTPFNFKKQALLVVPEDVADPTDPAFPASVASVVKEIVDLAEGRTLGLFTSYRNLNATYERIKNNGHRVLRQGDMPRTKLIEEFRRDICSVLLGTDSFWAGIDVPGEALSCLVIDRLPFPSPDDPVLDAIAERDKRWFKNYSLPRAAITFKQGFGRLIRTASDRGVVVVLDRRLVTKPYGRLFTDSLPDMFKSRRIANVRKFLQEAV